MNDQERKRILLDHYAGKPIQRFLQIDASTIGPAGGDDVVVPDIEGDVIFTAFRDELQTSDWDVRIRIPEGTDPKHLGRLLHKIACYLKACYDEPLDFGEPRDGVLGVSGMQDGVLIWAEFGRLTGDDGDEAERFPGWYDQHN